MKPSLPVCGWLAAPALFFLVTLLAICPSSALADMIAITNFGGSSSENFSSAPTSAREVEDSASPNNAYTNFPDGARGFFGPNFSFVAIPEPSSIVLIPLAGGAALLRRSRRRVV